MTAFRPCAVIPTYDNPLTLESVVETVHAYLPHVIVVDDGSDEPGAAAARRLSERCGIQLLRCEQNRGKGYAVKLGFSAAMQRGYTHALQVDADGQHYLGDIPLFLSTAAASPEALVLGVPQFGAEAPRARVWGRKITVFWNYIEVGGGKIHDGLCGFRVYPLVSACRSQTRGDRMEFDLEIAVRMVWLDVKVINVPTRVRYLSADEGGVSHFRMFRDNLRISMTHTRLVLTAPWALMMGVLRSLRRGLRPGPSRALSSGHPPPVSLRAGRSIGHEESAP